VCDLFPLSLLLLGCRTPGLLKCLRLERLRLLKTNPLESSNELLDMVRPFKWPRLYVGRQPVSENLERQVTTWLANRPTGPNLYVLGNAATGDVYLSRA
jgi:hypothetical protein